MKRIIYLILGALILLSCSRVNCAETDATLPITTQEAYSMFAKILSKAVANNIPLRSFIKETALEQFDLDFDVFYPYVKDEYVDDEKTFRNILLEYCNEDELSQIESAVPKLNILIPDWSWFGGPCASNWEIESDEPIYVGFAQNTLEHILFCNGNIALELSSGEFPSSPTLIIKDNERMKVSNTQTKGNVLEYDFVNSAFDKRNSIETKGRAWYEEYIQLPYETLSDFVPKSDISSILINAYNEFSQEDTDYGCQRDYVYYGMTHANDSCGYLNDYIRERIYRFRLRTDAYSTMSDQAGDPSLSDEIDIVSRNHELSVEDLLRRIWSGGAFEFRFDIYIGSEGNGSTTSLLTIPISATGSSVFDITQVHRKYKHTTLIAKGESIYTFNPDDLISKWIYPEGRLYIPKWDISANSNNVFFVIKEYDPDQTITETEYHSFTYNKNFNWKVDISAEGKADSVLVKGSLGIGGGNNQQTVETNQIVINTSLGSDFIGSGDVAFMQKILEHPMTEEIDGEIVDGFSVRSIDFGNIIVTLLPEDVRY